MIITPEKIEMWEKDPTKWDYDRGYDEATIRMYALHGESLDYR